MAFIDPDQFTGTDAQKLQKAYVYGLQNNIPNIVLGRMFNITGSSVYLPDNMSLYTLQEITITGGGIIKNDNGYFFTRAANNINCHAPIFHNVKFYGSFNSTAIVLDGNKMFRGTFSHCYFTRTALIQTNKYTQSLRVDHCEMWYATSSFIKGLNHFDLNITNNTFEESQSHLLEAVSTSKDEYALTGARITNNCIEGYVTISPIKISSGLALVISNNYFEANKAHIEIVATTGVRNVVGEISGNLMTDNRDTADIKCSTANILTMLNVQSNTSNIGAGKFHISKAPGHALNNHIYGGGSLNP